MKKCFEIGLYAPEIPEKPEKLFARARQLGASCMQYNFLNSHAEEMPGELDRGDVARIGALAKENGIRIDAVNGTFNMLEDGEKLEEDLRKFRLLASMMDALGSGALTLCTGSFSEKGMWAFDERSGSEEGFRRAVNVTKKLAAIADEYDLKILVETEASNAICTVERTRRYLDEVASDRLKVILDCANLFPAGTAYRSNVRPTIRRAFDLLGKDIALAHGKDVLEADKPSFTAPGLGIVDYPFFFDCLREVGYEGGLILHGIKHEEELAPSIARMKEQMQI